ncbi:hypothetical protein BT93_F0937 [Corymbia citriodora subsp. variegata]|nr:hypothetical protein BT93_F0937 [Corymbia citriodora subsp. variegata]
METERSEAPPCYRGLSEDELLVADILLELRWLFGDRFPLGWGAKRRRSALRRGSSSPSPAPPPQVKPPPQQQQQPAKCHARAAIEERAGQKKVHAASPDTPLSFSPSESDGNKPKQSLSRRKSTKRKRDDWLKLVALLEEQGAALRKEVENVRRYRDKVKALNSELKARKEELIIRAVPGESEQGPEPNTHLTLGGQSDEPAAAPLPSCSDRHLPPVPDQTASAPEKSEARDPEGPLASCGGGGGGGGLDIPDLNIGLAPFDVTMVDEEWSNRARAAQARQRRRLIYRAKNPTVAVKPRVQLR